MSKMSQILENSTNFDLRQKYQNIARQAGRRRDDCKYILIVCLQIIWWRHLATVWVTYNNARWYARALCIRRTLTRTRKRVMLQVFRVMLDVFPVTLQETHAPLQETRAWLHETRATLHETCATLQETRANLHASASASAEYTKPAPVTSATTPISSSRSYLHICMYVCIFISI